jgi:NADPH:quinone reductase-like Zn-dependent oxidoreductase
MMHLLPTLLRTTPAVPELDFAGTITALSATGNKGFCVGVPVFGSIPVAAHLKGAGALAGYVVLDSATVAAVPGVAGVKDESEVERRMREAAGLGVVGCTALALMKAAGLGRGDAVLVNGASGGIGHLVVQMCREAVGGSGRVVGVCSAGNAEMVRGLGADEVSWMRIWS